MDRRTFLTGVAAAMAATPALAQAPFVFGPWPQGKSPTEIGKRVAEHFVVQPHGNLGRPTLSKSIVYPESCAWYGALTFAQLAHDASLTQRLTDRFATLFTTDSALLPTASHVDPSAFGAVPFELYIETRDPRYLAIGKAIADRQWAPPSPEYLDGLKPEDRAMVEDAVAHGLSPQTRYWIDDMYMITILEVQAYRATKDPVYIDRAAREMVAYLDRLQQPNGLFFHAPDVPFFWGRGNGWFAAGMAEMLRSLPRDHPQHALILAGYHKMLASLLRYQDGNGMWRQLIDRPESWPETSCTGMFAFSMITGVKNGWLDADIYGPAAQKAWLGLVGYIDDNADIHEVCEGTNKKNDYSYYMDRKRNVGDLHGQAPVLWCASALLRPAAT
jgi:rhamnogalacturonyl hydrolase YesR